MKPEAVVKTAEFHSCGVERRLWLTRDILARPATDERLSQALKPAQSPLIAGRILSWAPSFIYCGQEAFRPVLFPGGHFEGATGKKRGYGACNLCSRFGIDAGIG
jgi:hypothetical protein